MLGKRIIVLSALAVSVSTAAIENRCNADYCLRALRATQFPTRIEAASSDCSSFLAGLVTVTYTDTQTLSTTTTPTVVITNTETIHATASTTVTETTTVTLEGPDPLSPSPEFQKREVASSAGLPDYAAPCSGAVRFRSACSCIGVTAVDPASTRITVSTTLSFTEESTVTETASSTTTDATTTITVVETETTYIAPSVPTSTSFKIKVTNINSGVESYLKLVDMLEFYYTVTTSDISEAALFQIEDTKLTCGGSYALIDYEDYSFVTFPVSLPVTQPAMVCEVSEALVLSCSDSRYPGTDRWVLEDGNDMLALSHPRTLELSWIIGSFLTLHIIPV